MFRHITQFWIDFPELTDSKYHTACPEITVVLLLTTVTQLPTIYSYISPMALVSNLMRGYGMIFRLEG